MGTGAAQSGCDGPYSGTRGLHRFLLLGPCYGHRAVTETRFGRDFSTHIVSLGGAKVKRRDRAYYEGVSRTVREIEISAPLRAAA